MVGGDMGDSGPRRAIRLTIVRDGNDLKVASSQSVKMRVPPSDPTYGFEDNSGFWFELRSDRQECVYRRVIPNPLADDLEAPSGDPERPFTRVPAPAREQVFVLLVPDTEEGRELVLCGAPRGAPTGKARAFAAVDLRKPIGKVRMIAAGDEPPERPTRKRGPATPRKKGRK